MPLRKRSSTEVDRDGEMTGNERTQDKENESSQEDTDMSTKTPSRPDKRRSMGFIMSAPMSPMKRTEAPVDLENAGFGSPSAKRRSLCGPSLDFSIFDDDSLAATQLKEQRRSHDDCDWFKSASPMSTSRFSTLPRRTSSLRKSTLQQRQTERSTNSKLSVMLDQDVLSATATPAFEHLKKGDRLSLDNHLSPPPHESPFASMGNLLSASIHPLGSAQNSQSQSYVHPLSQTITQSSSSASTQDDSPTHEPFHRPQRPRSHDFSKSLPVGALHPETGFQTNSSQESSSQGSFATPGNYKNAKPLPAAFMSTGLISKKNRNADEPNGGLPKAHMPDTPCKKQVPLFPLGNAAGTTKKPPAPKNARVSFGTPSTPFGTPQLKTTPFPFAKSISLFGGNAKRSSLHRKASFASIDGDSGPSPSPPTQRGSQSTEVEFPPTPTKHAIAEPMLHNRISPSPHQPKPLPLNHGGFATSQNCRYMTSKLSPIHASPASTDGDSDSVMDDSPSAILRPHSLLPVPTGASFTQGRALKNLNSPTPLSRKVLAFAALHSPKNSCAKLACASPVSTHPSFFDPEVPHTPQEAIFPVDPSGLSISGCGGRNAQRPPSSGAAVPCTPTGPRDYFANFSNRPSLNMNAADVTDVDESLSTRFRRVELAGTGEFSQVYRVSEPSSSTPFRNIQSLSSTRSSSRSSLPEKVWAVKKTRYPYSGPKDRQKKIHEVDVLKNLVHNDHVVNFVDSWEDHGHLYIQTDFCDEGTLEMFLAQVGLKARLDDFRIWKILFELGHGLQHIHERGFIHLDLKPANVLISFEGVLKIADFGMATRWPARAGIEGEGDREYIGPEILKGQYDKPADIFALGLIVLEIAGNVELPDNGASWQKLRNGDMSDVPSLTWTSEESNIFRDASGDPIPSEDVDYNDTTGHDGRTFGTEQGTKAAKYIRNGELTVPPAFMVDASNEQALDHVVRWMISPELSDRPTADRVLHTVGVRWAEHRRRAGATVFEGNWGPADEVLAEDAEMIDV